MKSLRIFAVVTILTVLALTESMIVVNADTLTNIITKDFGQTNLYSSDNSGNTTYASINVKATIETETTGHWIVNNSYKVKLLIAINYVNESVYNPNFFAIECYRNNYPISVQDATLSPLTNNVTVTPQNNGTILMIVKPLIVKVTGLYFNFALTVYYNNSIISSGSWWTQGSKNIPPIPITVDENQQFSSSTPVTPEFSALALLPLLLSILSVAVILGHRRIKKL